MADIEDASVTVTDEPTELSTTRSPAQDIIVCNVSENTIYLGGPEVTVDSGIPLVANAIYTYTLPRGVQLYAIADDDSEVRINRLGVHS